MTRDTWEFGPGNGTVTVHTDVTGPAARTGHRLTIDMEQWSAELTVADGVPVGVAASIDVESLRVVSGEGGVTPLTGPEKAIARGNALKSLNASKAHTITYDATSITATENGFRLDGTLTINNNEHPHPLDVEVSGPDDARQANIETVVSHREFGLKPYSMMMGALKVVDDVRVVITVDLPPAG
ncbi:YceI family protein [Gordonia otitidis]|uniref:Lipid/polyisoprenoid-binding YceI-like domain-containing protein n=1 Tax=Gordonia otitidis (strain DSM 44809 / CCUG 52243 / JCM 12355 / NBRC 100426 / IFM 10032) TaxID=1108044 RepID=H5TTG4_GORO1|nr:YceI family protein [Gordonia otitidis]GAB36772.1 hypothetical protein GOOTI_239_00190 [Gordonia otitidis NBRC 100426]